MGSKKIRMKYGTKKSIKIEILYVLCDFLLCTYLKNKLNSTFLKQKQKGSIKELTQTAIVLSYLSIQKHN